MWILLVAAAFAFAWVGHAYLWTSLLSHLYGRPLPKKLLKVWRYITGLIVFAFPALLAVIPLDFTPVDDCVGRRIAQLYTALCLLFGAVVFPAITIARFLRKRPACVVSESTHTLDLWPELGAKLFGDGKLAVAARLPGNGVFRIDFTDLTLALPHLPAEWEGLTIQVVNDLHFHGTPARVYFERIVEELTALPVPDLVVLPGDFVDSHTHHEWIVPLLGRLTARAGKFAILGNHDRNHEPERVRAELTSAGYTTLGNTWRETTIRGMRCVVVGHEGPWFTPPPDLANAPDDCFRLCLSHSPDNFYWGIANRIDLMLCGHVHGGAIRLPVVGSLFVPSIYGRRFDQGVFEKDGTIMAVNRGLSGREPIRYRCNPQVLRVKLVRRRSEG